MPDKFVVLDTGLPSWSGSETLTEKVDALYSHQYQLLESLRYMMRHLDRSNFDEAGIKSITEPISVSLREDFNSMQLEIDAGGISAVIEGLESTLEMYVKSDEFRTSIESLDGDISTLRQTVNSFSTRIETAEGKASTALQTANGFETRVSNNEGNISSLRQTVSGLQSSVSSQNGKISTLTQTVNGFETRVSNNEGNISSLRQSIDSFTMTVSSSSSGTSTFQLKADGAVLSTQNVDMYVKSTNIYGKLTADQIEVGDLSAGKIKGDTVYIQNSSGSTTGYIYTTDTSLGDGLMLQGSNGMKLTAWDGNVYIRSHQSYSGNAPSIVLQWQDNDPLRGTIQLVGGAIVLDSMSFGNYLPSNPVYGQVYFLRN